MIEKTLNYYKLQTGPSSYSRTGPYSSSPRKVPPFSFFSGSGALGGDPQQKRQWHGSRGKGDAASWLAAAPTSSSCKNSGEAANGSSSRARTTVKSTSSSGTIVSSRRRAASSTVPQSDQAHRKCQAVTPTRCVGDEVMEVGSSGGQAVEEEEDGQNILREDETRKGEAAF
ncbi:hypothetical protein M9H77_25935 [Catharanthus roseus]|uniref:Uncharacterized protein n=1 Tax=Catharanthus roseus TaxID=4058 RepID=A0ACC0A9L3_CATRO|nr:hypothetical protein M9H77_25935 [Catharanthus roseus]